MVMADIQHKEQGVGVSNIDIMHCIDRRSCKTARPKVSEAVIMPLV